MAKKNNSKAMNNSTVNASRPVSPDEVYANREVIKKAGRHYHWDESSCEDLVQEVALKCWRNPSIRFNHLEGTLAGYLYQIALFTAVDIWRKNRHLPLPVEDVELVAMLEAEVPEKFDTELHKERMKLLELGIREMYRRYPSKDGNDAFVMFSRYGMSARQVAEKLSVEERFVNVAVHRGVERLAKIVRRMELDENWRNVC